MKKTITTIAILLGVTLGALAQQSNGGIFQRGYTSDEPYSYRDSNSPLVLPTEHGSNVDYEGPLGSGIAVLVGLGAAYLVGKKRKEE